MGLFFCKRWLKVFFLAVAGIILICAAATSLFIPSFLHSSSIKIIVLPAENKTKLILFWNKFFRREHPDLHNDLSKCAVKTCKLTDDRSLLLHSAAVVIHAGSAKVYDLPSPHSRRPEQYYVFYHIENPYRTTPDFRQPPWPGFFNLTWTYRWDSDFISTLYIDQFRPRLWYLPTATHRTMLQKRKNEALALVSHCAATSNRDLYIRELARYFPVAFMGECGTSNHSVWEYDENVVKQYKFYLAFENG